LIYEGNDFIYLLKGLFDVDMSFIWWLNVDFFFSGIFSGNCMNIDEFGMNVKKW